MKFGETEISDAVLELALEKAGKKVVESKDYERKASAANDLAKFRGIYGEERSLDELEKILTEHTKREKDNKTQLELLMEELKSSKSLIAKAEKEKKEAQREVRVEQRRKYFSDAQAKLGKKILPAILEDHVKDLYDVEVADDKKTEFDTLLAGRIEKAFEAQKAQLEALGIKVEPENPGSASSFTGGGFSDTARQSSLPADINQLLTGGAASSTKTGFEVPTPRK